MTKASDSDREIWRSFKVETAQDERPTTHVLAAYLDGKASAAEEAQVMRWLAGSDTACKELMALKGSLANDARERDEMSAKLGGLMGAIAVWRRPAQGGYAVLAATVLAVVVSFLVGFEIGTTLSVDRQNRDVVVVDDIFFGLGEDDQL